MDVAFKSKPFPGFTTAELRASVAAGTASLLVIKEVERRDRVASGDVSSMTDAERLRHARKGA